MGEVAQGAAGTHDPSLLRSRSPGSPYARSLGPRITALPAVRGWLAPADARAQGLLGRIDRPLQQLTGSLGIGSVRVIVRAERGALGSCCAWSCCSAAACSRPHQLIDGVTMTLPAPQLPLLVRVPGRAEHLARFAGGRRAGRRRCARPESHLAADARPRRADAALAAASMAAASASAVIDSGLVRDRHLRDPPLRRLHPRRRSGKSYTENAAADRRVRPWHARRRPDCRQRRRLERPLSRRRAGRGAGRPEGARRQWRRPHERRARGARVRDRPTARALGLRVVNLSLGHPIFEPAGSRSAGRRPSKPPSAPGLVVVVSAGNFGCLPNGDRCGYAGITSPGNAPSAITVGAHRHAQTDLAPRR